MSIPTAAQLTVAVRDAAAVLSHPWKGRYAKQADGTLVDLPADEQYAHRYGSPAGTVVYFEGGHVGIALDGGTDETVTFLIAEGGDHEDSILALARYIGATDLDNGVAVRHVSGGHFWLRCFGE